MDKKQIRIVCLLLLLTLLLCSCRVRDRVPDAASDTEAARPLPTTEPQLPPERDPLPGTWVNTGRYSEGRDFVETLELREDGTFQVHLDYQGQPYADLAGSWTREGKTLTFTMEDGTVRVYTYSLDGRFLNLTGNGKTVEYVSG